MSIVFDFDGVIADSLSHCTTACRNAAMAMGAPHDLPPNPFADLDDITFEALALELGLLPHPFADRVADEIWALDPAPLFQGMGDVLRALAPVAIVTASTGRVVERVLDFGGCREAVRGIFGRDLPGKKQDKLMKLASEGRAHAMIGDAVSDLRAAEAAGLAFVGVAWGWHSPEKLVAAGAHMIATSPFDLLSTVNLALAGRGVAS